jgi:hypothetical protein
MFIDWWNYRNCLNAMFLSYKLQLLPCHLKGTSVLLGLHLKIQCLEFSGIRALYRGSMIDPPAHRQRRHYGQPEQVTNRKAETRGQSIFRNMNAPKASSPVAMTKQVKPATVFGVRDASATDEYELPASTKKTMPAIPKPTTAKMISHRIGFFIVQPSRLV